MKERYEGFMRDVPCPGVRSGTRLKPEILAARWPESGGASQVHSAEVCEPSIADATSPKGPRA